MKKIPFVSGLTRLTLSFSQYSARSLDFRLYFERQFGLSRQTLMVDASLAGTLHVHEEYRQVQRIIGVLPAHPHQY